MSCHPLGQGHPARLPQETRTKLDREGLRQKNQSIGEVPLQADEAARRTGAPQGCESEQRKNIRQIVSGTKVPHTYDAPGNRASNLTKQYLAS